MLLRRMREQLSPGGSGWATRRETAPNRASCPDLETCAGHVSRRLPRVRPRRGRALVGPCPHFGRAALVAGIMLVEYTVMEQKRQQERDNRNNGAPGVAEMER